MSKLRTGLHLLSHPRRLVGLISGPKVLVTSVPKAGTNLVVHVLSQFPQLTPQETIILLPLQAQLTRISTMRPGRIVSTHLPPGPELDCVLDENNVKVIFISRDPRDVCVSLSHYIVDQPSHELHVPFCDLTDAESRLMAVIKGYDAVSVDGTEVHLPSVRESFADRLRWRESSRSCDIAFEELVGSRGGGDDVSQMAAIERMAAHLHLSLSRNALVRISKNAFSQRSPTFRRGQIGAWRLEMSEAHKDAFKDVAGDLLIALGYEDDLDW